ncbi:DUF262 domain-containing protein [uncultured Treponema sp.]|uniref:DUF262 domain-containing protein n=1 Tax=uncultured Treponema sp. TaxID=162155 RepID=UPI0025FE501D|nr:DUF262 domain-containing protein [uncultured Treponema sp.]
MEKNKTVEKLENDIELQQRNVSYDTKEYTIELIVNKYLNGIDENINEFFVPDYQREFVWDNYRQSRFIESLLIGLPIPYIFLAETKEGRYEIVDGSQRIRTLAAFLQNELKINKLDVLTSLNGFLFKDMLSSRQRKLKNISLKMIVLSERTSDKTKNEIFERINRGSDLLKDMEKRKGIYRGAFNDFIYDIAENELFIKLTPIAKWFENRQEREELLLRFFAFYDIYPHFKNNIGIARQLDDYMSKENEQFKQDINEKKTKEFLFNKMIKFVSLALPNGFSKNGSNQVSRVYFEAISVGIALALKEDSKLDAEKTCLKETVKSTEFMKIISGKYNTHTPERIIERIDFIRDKLLGR